MAVGNFPDSHSDLADWCSDCGNEGSKGNHHADGRGGRGDSPGNAGTDFFFSGYRGGYTQICAEGTLYVGDWSAPVTVWGVDLEEYPLELTGSAGETAVGGQPALAVGEEVFFGLADEKGRTISRRDSPASCDFLYRGESRSVSFCLGESGRRRRQRGRRREGGKAAGGRDRTSGSDSWDSPGERMLYGSGAADEIFRKQDSR